MSRAYEMYVEIRAFDADQRIEIESAVSEEWNFVDWYFENGASPRLTASGRSNLCGGETEEEFADRLYEAIEKANGKPCALTLDATCLENLPRETHKRGSSVG
jgi:hypothetical protein